MSASFHEIQFPTDISYGATGGPGFLTVITEVNGGDEYRNIEWSRTRAEYDVVHGVKNQTKMDILLAFFYARNGRGYGFRYKDWADFKSCSATGVLAPGDQVCQCIATGAYTANGVGTTFQLYKSYTDAGGTFRRKIIKPVTGTIRVSVNGVEKTITTHWTIDVTTGIITFTGGNTPVNTAVVTAGYEFDVPVRFDADKLKQELTTYQLNTWGGILLVELKNP